MPTFDNLFSNTDRANQTVISEKTQQEIITVRCCGVDTIVQEYPHLKEEFKTLQQAADIVEGRLSADVLQEWRPADLNKVVTLIGQLAMYARLISPDLNIFRSVPAAQ